MYKVWVSDDNVSFATNALEFESAEEAVVYARDLFSRWMAMVDWVVIPLYALQAGAPIPLHLAYAESVWTMNAGEVEHNDLEN